MDNQQKSVAIWRHLEKTGGARKDTAARQIGIVDENRRYCPACDEAETIRQGREGIICNYCPMRNRWPAYDSELAPVETCEDDDSAYVHWLDTDYEEETGGEEERKMFATIIAEALENDWGK